MMHHPGTILATSDLSENSTPALQRAALLAREHGARLELLHVLENFSHEDLPEGSDSGTFLRELTRDCEEALRRQAENSVGPDIPFDCRIETGKDFVTIIRHAREVAANLIVLGAHGSHSVRDLFLGTTPERVIRKGGIPVLTVRGSPRRSYERVLAAIDFSEGSRQALLTALALAPGARLDLLHGYELWGLGRLSMAGGEEKIVPRYHQQIWDHAEKRMDEFLQGIDLAGRKVERHFRSGHPPALISDLAGDLQADLVAMGTEGRSGLPYILIGSVAERVLHQAPCDVLTVRPPGFRFELP